jgi:cell growth-regulating nucleolar protein
MDCQKDFRGDEYKSHIKCITEEQKYSGVGWKPPPGHLKGEKKQMSWTETIRMASSDSKLIAHLDASTRRLLLDLTKHDNIPRKKPKFMNFIKNTTRNRFDDVAFEKVWAILETQMKTSHVKEEKKTVNNSVSTNGDIAKDESSIEDTLPNSENVDVEENGAIVDTVNKKKKKKKSKHRDENIGAKEHDNAEGIDDSSVSIQFDKEQEKSAVTEECTENMPAKKKKKKSKHRDESDVAKEDNNAEGFDDSSVSIQFNKEQENGTMSECTENMPEKKKKKKSKRKEETPVIDEQVIAEAIEGKIKKKKKSKQKEEKSDVEKEIHEKNLENEPKKKKSKRNAEKSVPTEVEDTLEDLSCKPKKRKRTEESSAAVTGEIAVGLSSRIMKKETMYKMRNPDAILAGD